MSDDTGKLTQFILINIEKNIKQMKLKGEVIMFAIMLYQ